jgi:MerR family transcriptional regulator/heat shock protein HspR
MKKKKGYFSISAVADIFTVHQQTIRLYEREGLISPKRSQGNTRLFSEEDVKQLEEIIYLTHKVGINLAGVEMILKLQRQIARLQKEMNTLFSKTQEELERERGSQTEIARLTAAALQSHRSRTTRKRGVKAATAPREEESVPDLDIHDQEGTEKP